MFFEGNHKIKQILKNKTTQTTITNTSLTTSLTTTTSEVITTTKNKTTTKKTKTTITTTTVKNKSYYCPDNYVLDGNKCVSTTNPHLECTGNQVSIDNGCIDFNDKYETTDSCPSGYYLLKLTGFGVSDTYYCHKIYSKTSSCDDGYNLVENKCIKTIDALLA